MWLLLACQDPAPDRGDATDDPEPTDSVSHTGDTGGGGTHTADSGHTGTTTTTDTGTAWVRPAFCDDLPVTVLSQTVFDIETTEDFDFDADGRLVYVDWNGNYMGARYDETTALISPSDGWNSDARGVQVLSTGETAINYISGGKIVAVDPATGGRVDLLVGVQGPNALEVGDGDVIYFTEASRGRVGWYDRATETGEVIATGFAYPNGLALSPDQHTLYVSDDFNGIYRLVRDPVTGAWGGKQRVFNPAPGESYDAMETDECGNLYSAQFYSGKIYRYDPYVDVAELVVDLDDPSTLLWNAMRWGSNRGGWRRDTLYVTSRAHIFALELGVNGRNQPVDLIP